MQLPLNLTIMKNPLNWVIVFLMLAIAASGVAIVGRFLESQKGTAQT